MFYAKTQGLCSSTFQICRLCSVTFVQNYDKNEKKTCLYSRAARKGHITSGIFSSFIQAHALSICWKHAGLGSQLLVGHKVRK